MTKNQLIWFWWNSTLECYCKSRIFRSASHWIPCKESLAAIYAVHPDQFNLTTKSGSVVIPKSNGLLELEPGMEYNVTLTSLGEQQIASDLKEQRRIPIKKLATEFEQRVGEIRVLSAAFYDNVWLDPDEKFRMMFTRNTTKERAIEHQSMWLHEVWGGQNKAYSQKYGNDALFRRMLGKHPNSIMTLGNAMRWIRNMNKALDSVVADEVMKITLRLYWGHFLGFFPFQPEERVILMNEMKLWDSLYSKL